MSAVDECAGKLGHADETERSYAAEDLGYLNSAEAVRALLGRLPREPSLIVRDAIAQALIRFDGEEAIQGAVGLLMSDDAQLRNLAVGVLKHRVKRAIPFLMTVMNEGDADMRKFVLDALYDFEGKDADGIYAAALADDDPNIVITAVENIGRAGLKAFRIQVEKLFRETEEPMLLCACLETLGGIGNDSSLKIIEGRFGDSGAIPGYLRRSYVTAVAALGGEGWKGQPGDSGQR